MIYLSLLCALIFSTSLNVIADPGGKAGRLLTTSGGCGDCHGGSPSTATSVSIISKSGSFTVKPGTKLELTAAVAHPSKLAAGINIGVKSAPNSSTNIGTLDIVAGQGLKKSQSELVQSSPKNMTNGKTEFSFTWTAPTQEGTYFIMATGNAVNRNGGDSGDEWNYMQPIQLTVSSTTDIGNEFEHSQVSIFPNPIQEHSVLEYQLPTNAKVSYTISNTLGQFVVKNDLGYQFQGKNILGLYGLHPLLPSGHYILSVFSEDFRISIPFIKQ